MLTLRFSAQMIEDSLATYTTIRSVPAAGKPPVLLTDVEAQQSTNEAVHSSATATAQEESKQHSHSLPSYSEAPPPQQEPQQRQQQGDTLREEHCQHMERLHAALIYLSVTNARLVDWMHADFLQEISNSNIHDGSHGNNQQAVTMLTESYESGDLEFSSQDSIMSSARSPEDMELYQIYLQDVNGGENSSSSSARGSRNFSGESVDRQKKVILLEATMHKLFGIQICFNAFFYSCHHLARVVMDMSDTIFTLTELAQKKSHQPF